MMRVQITETSIKLWLSAFDTGKWANPCGLAWPCSTLAGRRLCAEFDSNGLVDITIGGRWNAYCPADELNAITSDFLRDKLSKDHSLYHITVGQFDQQPSNKE